MTDKTLTEVLSEIQQKLAVPKNRKNTFGNYNYRNAEDIIDAVKKVLPEGATIIITDALHLVGDRYYIRSQAAISYKNDVIRAEGWARESEEKKGMDSAQLTGATSSYAKKYALCNLFAIDDGIDSDLLNNGEKKEEKKDTVAEYAKALAKSIVAGVKKQKTEDSLLAYWDSKADDIAKVRTASLNTCKWLIEQYGARMQELKNG